MGVTASCRNGTGYESDHGGTGSEAPEPTMNGDEVIETVVCREDELPDYGMKCFAVEGSTVLVVREYGLLSALGSKCSHYGAPLENGEFTNGRIRCPWHGACFNAKTGDIEDYPGLDSIPRYDIDIEDGYVKVRAPLSELLANKRTKPMANRDPENLTTFVVIGGGAAGATCVEKLRQEGFTGQVTLVSREEHLPYDRPKLSKAMDLTSDKITLRSQQFYESGDIELRLGTTAVSVDTEGKK
ncbi:Apoptosis-inducing factor 3, partial [Halocaridina rubra]